MMMTTMAAMEATTVVEGATAEETLAAANLVPMESAKTSMTAEMASSRAQSSAMMETTTTVTVALQSAELSLVSPAQVQSLLLAKKFAVTVLTWASTNVTTRI